MKIIKVSRAVKRKKSWGGDKIDNGVKHKFFYHFLSGFNPPRPPPPWVAPTPIHKKVSKIVKDQITTLYTPAVHVIQSWEDYNSFSSYIKSSHQKILNSLCLTEECTLSSSSMLGNVFNMDHKPCTDPSIRNVEQSQPTRFCLLGVQLNEGVHIDQSRTRVPRHTCVLRHSNPDVWSHSLYCSSHQQDYLGRGRLQNQKKPTAEVLRMGALLANEDAVFSWILMNSNLNDFL